MTSPRRHPRPTDPPVDLDMLADFTDGLLDDAEARFVAGRIAADERWATTHAALLAALPATRGALAVAGADPEPMPAEVTARIMAALRGLGTFETDNAASASLSASSRTATGSSGPATRVDRVVRPSGRPAHRSRWAVAATTVAAVVVLAGFGGLLVKITGTHHTSASDSSTRTAAGAAPPKAPMGVESALVGVVVTNSNANYTAATLGTITIAPQAARPSITFNGTRPGIRLPAGALAGLGDSATLSTCVAAITTAHGGQAVLVDFARYDGEPAVIVTLSAPDVAVAVGPRCGAPGAGDDELAVAPRS